MTLPGAFIGVLLGGGSPAQAAAAQVLVLMGIMAAQTTTAVVAERLIGEALLLPDGATVVVPEGETGVRRLSIPFFHNANWDAVIDCIPSCLQPGEAPKYPPIEAGPHLMQKFRSTVNGY